MSVQGNDVIFFQPAKEFYPIMAKVSVQVSRGLVLTSLETVSWQVEWS